MTEYSAQTPPHSSPKDFSPSENQSALWPVESASMRMLQGLNPEQLSAVTLPHEHALILAGAGSGKTRVLTTRIAYLLQTGQITPGGLLAVTFTNKAAKEMLTRLESMLPLNVKGLWMGTFHGLCHRMLKAHWKMANLPQAFQILDTQDQLSAIKRLCKQFSVDEERFPPKQLQWFIAAAKEEAKRPQDLPVNDPDSKKRVELYHLYEEQCNREGVVDFAELMLRSYELLRDNPALKEHYQRRFQHLLIDEFQDTNRLQYAWIKMLCGNDSAVFAVGDDDQSIYAFRGARVGNMADFVREFNVRHQIKLEQNYRSSGSILETANTLIQHNSQRLGKNLRTDQGQGDLVRVLENASDYEEAQCLVDEVHHLLREGQNGDGSGAQGVKHRSDIAFLYRSNAQSRVIESALFNASIPYKVYGGLRFFERAEIKNALAYLRLLENPNEDTSFLRVVNFPPRGIGARTIEQLQDAATRQGCSLHASVELVSGKAGVNLQAFVAKMDVMREQILGLTLREIMELVLDHSGLVEHYRTEKEGADRVENLEELVNAAESFVMQEGFGKDAPATQVQTHAGLDQYIEGAQGVSSPKQVPDAQGASLPQDAELSSGWVNFDTGETLSPLAAFLSHAALEAGDNQAQAGQDAVQLMTVHAAKGLEFDCVFITGLEEGLFPHENSLSSVEGLEEERRLMYVALTRARKRLYLSHAQTRMLHGQTRFNMRSRFFDEMPEHTMKWINAKKPSVPSSARGYSGASNSRDFSSNAYTPAWGRSTNSSSRKSTPQEALPVRAIKADASDPNAWMKVGLRVFHNKFGEGKILALEGIQDDARAQVDFPRHGVKWLALSLAKLTQID